MEFRKRSDWVGGMRVTLMMFLVMLVALCGILMPQTAEAQPNKKDTTKCSQCHNDPTLNPLTGTYAAVDGVEGTNFFVSPSSTIEIDFIFRDLRGPAYQARGVAPYLGLPAGWTPLATTNGNNPATLNGVAWNTLWDNPWSQGTPSSTPSWQITGAEDGTVPGLVSTNMYKGLFEGSSWENGSGAVMDNGVIDGVPDDLDGIADVMGADVRLNIPASGGPWTVFVGGVGHGNAAKSISYTAITLTLSGGDATAPVPNNDVAVSVESGTFVPAAFDVTATFAEPEGNVSGCEYTLNNGGAWSAGVVSGAGPYTCTANVTGQADAATLDISMRMTSAGGQSAASTYYPTRTVDAAAPTTTDDVPGGWQTTDVTVTLTPTDGGSGIASTVYCVDQANACVPGTAYAAPFLVSTEDNNFVRYQSTDNLGNVQTVVSKTLDIDKTAPTDGALTPTPGDVQIQLDWTAATDATSGLGAPAYKVVMASGTTTPPADCSGAAIYTGSLLTHTQTGLTNGLDYAFRVCAFDAAGLVSTGATATAQPSLVCTPNTPSFTITQLNQQITAGSGTVVYDVTVTNNDSGGCAADDFTLNVVSDSNATDFAASTTGAMPLNIAPGGNAATTVTVTAAASPTNGNNNITTLNVSAPGHTTSANQTRTTWINLPVSGTLNYNIGDNIHIEYQTTTRLTNTGTNALSLYDSLGNAPVVGGTHSMIEVQSGGSWIYFYNWDTTGESAESYTVDIGDVAGIRSTGVTLNNPANQMTFYSDSNYTVPTDIFDDSATVYVEVQLSSAENGTANPGGLNVTNYTGTVHDVTNTTGIIETQTGGTVYRFNFVFDPVSAGLASGDWGYVVWAEAAGPLRLLNRPIQFVTGGCASCTQSDPTLDITTGNQTISTEGGFVDYTIQVTNNDTVSCGPTTFTLTANDSDGGTIFAVPSTFPSLVGNQLTVPAASSSNTTLRVTAQAGQYSGTNDSDFSTDAANGHAAKNSFTDFAKRVTTTLSVPDLTAPSINITNPPNGSYLNAASADPQSITGIASDNRGTVSSADVQINGGAWNAASTSDGYANWTWSWALPADGAYTIDARALDPATNTGNATQISVTVDRTDPTTSDDILAIWTATDRTVSLIETDATSGVSTTPYCIDGANSCVPAGDYAAPFAVNQGADTESLQYVRYYSTDVAGNAQTLVSKVVRIDKKAPADGASFTPTPGDGSISLAWDVATDGGSGIDTVNTYKVVRADLTTTAPADCSAAGIYTGSTPSFNDTGLNNGDDYAYRVCAYDNVGWVSTGLTATAQPAAACNRATPTISLEANKDVTTDGGFVDYTITVTNNDSGGCAAQTFDITTLTDNGTSFTLTYPNGLTTASIGIGASDTSLVARVTANGGALNGATHTTGVIVDSSGDPNHSDSTEAQAVTTMNVPCVTAPTISWLTANQEITLDGGTAVYNIQVQNDNAVACGSTDFDLVLVDDNAVAFATPSVFATDPLTVAPNGGTNTTTITVTSEAGATNGATNNTYFYTAVNGTIPTSGNSPTRTTTINRPCVPAAPSFSHALNKTIAPDGTAVYDLTIINGDVDCAPSTWTFSIDSEVEAPVPAAGHFTLASTFSSPTVTVASGATDSTVTLTVVGSGTGTDGDNLTSTIRITDATNHNGLDQTTAPVTSIKVFDPMIHSSAATGSTKHSGSGGWGISGGLYGEFTCATCHSQNKADLFNGTDDNIKRIRGAINQPTTALDGRPVTFTDAIYVPAANFTDMGDDSTGVPRASSNRVCEVCHTYDASKANGVFAHAYDQQLSVGHEDGKKCTSCHKHNDGFSKAGATCDSCHGYPPSPGDATTTPVRNDDGFGYQAVEGKGAHVEHVNHLATLAGVVLNAETDSYGDPNVSAVCGVCHDMSGATHEMGGGAGANRNINFNGSTAFQFGASAPAYNGIEDDPSATTPKTCSNINCHYQATPWWE